jgi:hypothetical protein
MARKQKAAPPMQQGGLFDDSAVVLTGFVPSAYQQAIFDWVVSGTGDGAVRAVAGSGKSTTLEQAAKLVRSGRAIFCAFNKHIADSLGQRLTGTPFAARTIHQIGYGVLARSFAGSLTVLWELGEDEWLKVVRVRPVMR